MQKITQEIINYFRNERASVRQWCQAQSWRTAIILVVLALLAQVVLWVSTGYYHVSLMLLAAALGMYAFTSLSWLTAKDGWGTLFLSGAMTFGLSVLIAVVYLTVLNPSLLDEPQSWMLGIIIPCAVVPVFASFIQDKRGSWLHTRTPLMLMVWGGILLGPEWTWLGLLFPAVVLILARLARYVIFLFRLFIGNPVLHFVRKDQR